MIPIIQWIDTWFQNLIFLPVIILLLFGMKIIRRDTRQMRCLSKVCLVLVLVFLIRCFLAHFIFTPVNYSRFTDTGYFPLVRALFYPIQQN